jgi:hypothetical protein
MNIPDTSYQEMIVDDLISEFKHHFAVLKAQPEPVLKLRAINRAWDCLYEARQELEDMKYILNPKNKKKTIDEFLNFK